MTCGKTLGGGLPVAACDHAARSQLIHHGENGLLAPLAQTAQSVQQAVAAARDPALARALGRQARETALSHGWDPIVGQVEVTRRVGAPRGAGQNPGCSPAGVTVW